VDDDGQLVAGIWPGACRVRPTRSKNGDRILRECAGSRACERR